MWKVIANQEAQKVFSKTIYVCGKCGRQSDEDHVRGWLMGESKNAEDRWNGVMVIRCTDCITEYAIRKAQNGKRDIRQ